MGSLARRLCLLIYTILTSAATMSFSILGRVKRWTRTNSDAGRKTLTRPVKT